MVMNVLVNNLNLKQSLIYNHYRYDICEKETPQKCKTYHN